MKIYGFALALAFAAVAPGAVLGQVSSSSTSSAAVEDTSPDLEALRSTVKTVITESGPDLTPERMEALTGVKPESRGADQSLCCIEKAYAYKLPGADWIWYRRSTAADGSLPHFDWNFLTDPGYNMERTDCLTLQDVFDDARSSGWTIASEGASWDKHGFWATKGDLKLNAMARGGPGENARHFQEVEALLGEKGCVSELRVEGSLHP